MNKKINSLLSSKSYRLVKVIYIIFILTVIIFSANIFSPYRCFTNNISDSMNPSINRGSITIVKKLSNYNVGDIITYYDNSLGYEEVVTHRIKSIGGNVYTTKGDANEVADRELVKPRLVIGKVIYVIPFLGFLVSSAKSPLGTALLIITPAIIIIILESLNILINSKRERE